MDEDTGLRAISEALGVALPHDAERDAVLDLTRVVAHSSQRHFGPLAAYGLALAMSHDATPQQRLDRLRTAIAAIESRPPD
ncbi:MAG TPA: DUF6457 domain-containing protein [Euzebya sp.]|nr:DUF6457 domain-containing protein [Euzebya sp.]